MKRIFLFGICILLVISPAIFAQGGKATSEDDGRTVITFRSWSPVVVYYRKDD